MRNRITIVDYGIGNLGSISNMFKRIGAPAHVTSDFDEIGAAEKLLLPGVGAFDVAMDRIDQSGLRPILDHKALVDKVPTLGICLGMQLLTRRSDEGLRPGLGWVAADTRRLPPAPGLKIPHMGWNIVTQPRPSRLTKGLPDDARFYFVHSYAVHVDSPENAILRARHGIEFDAAVEQDNIWGAQFHPEKSHRFGMQLLANFAAL